jgi:glyoxylase-like metal-dependent hydrolase (beta-lactamase superfamily II)
VPRSLALSPTATWWPSVLWQTTTLELHREGVRLLIDPGIAPWEVEEAAGDGVQHVLLTHGDWDHVMGVGLLPDARVHAGEATAQRIASGEAEESVRKEARVFSLPLRGLDRLRVDETISPGELLIRPWEILVHRAPGHTGDGIATSWPDEQILVVGDYLSLYELPFVYGSAWDYRWTLNMLLDLISRDRPHHVVVGHGHPHDPDTAMRIGAADLDYVEALVSHAEGGGDPEAADAVPYPDRGGSDDAKEHADNVRRACEIAARS